jgi:hypothetical protein
MRKHIWRRHGHDNVVCERHSYEQRGIRCAGHAVASLATWHSLCVECLQCCVSGEEGSGGGVSASIDGHATNSTMSFINVAATNNIVILGALVVLQHRVVCALSCIVVLAMLCARFV